MDTPHAQRGRPSEPFDNPFGTGSTLYARRVQTAAERRSFLGWLARTDTGRAAGLGVSMIGANVIALVFTVVFARILGATDYG